VICVVSAVGGITDKLLKAGELAQSKHQNYKSAFDAISDKHHAILSELIPSKNEAIATHLKTKLQELRNLLDGIFLINELSPKTSDKLVSFGELLSAYIIAETMKSRGMDCALKNSQELIVTNSNFTKAEVQYQQTNNNITSYFSEEKQQITMLPGFISKSIQGEITTLGRGGSDFTAAIVAAALHVNSLEIWTDVNGMYTSNPKLWNYLILALKCYILQQYNLY
jgi:aspartokinase/homoserine dehydrogenase 1